MTDLGRKVRAWRFRHGVILGEMASLMGVTSAELSAWEVGRKPWPSAMRLRIEGCISFDREMPVAETS